MNAIHNLTRVAILAIDLVRHKCAACAHGATGDAGFTSPVSQQMAVLAVAYDTQCR